MGKEKQNKTIKRLTASVVTIIALAVCLCATTFALAFSLTSMENNLFQTGTISLNLNDGRPVIAEDEFWFEPGMTVEKNFFIENQSTWDVYYKLYLEDVEGGLADVLEINLREGDKTLFRGPVSELNSAKVGAADDILSPHERRELTISFHFPKNAENIAQSHYLSFTLGADAVQTKNNPRRLFH